jgi:hypothetical protein
MKTTILILFSAFLIAACTTERGRPTAAAQPASPIFTNFSTSEKDTLEVRITDRQPANQVELAAPDGRIFPAYSIDRERLTQQGGGAQPSVGVGVGVGVGSGGHTSVGTGVGFGFPFVIGGSSGEREPQVKSTARVRITDMTAYRAQWQQWKVRVYLGDGGNLRVLEAPAPMPPA